MQRLRKHPIFISNTQKSSPGRGISWKGVKSQSFMLFFCQLQHFFLIFVLQVICLTSRHGERWAGCWAPGIQLGLRGTGTWQSVPRSQRCSNRGTVGHKAGRRAHFCPGLGSGELGRALRVGGLTNAKARSRKQQGALWEWRGLGVPRMQGKWWAVLESWPDAVTIWAFFSRRCI